MRKFPIKCLFGNCLIIIILSLLTPCLVFADPTEDNPLDLDYKVEQDNKDLFDVDDPWEPERLQNYLSLAVNLGFNFFREAPENIKLSSWGSRALGCNLYYNMPIKTSYFTISFGLDMAHADYSPKAVNTLTRNHKDPSCSIVKPARLVLSNRSEVQKSYFSIWSADLITELRFSSNKEEINEGFFCTIGGNVGTHLSPSTTIEYKEDNESKKRIIEERFNIARLRYGVLASIGWGRFGFFYHHILSPVFNKKGPNKDVKPFSLGITISLL